MNDQNKSEDNNIVKKDGNVEEFFESCYSCIHSEQECQEIIQLARIGQIGRVRRRLNENEKAKIRPGSVYVYKEQESGIRRWTDKKEWTPSRVQGIFLVYKDLNGQLIKKTYACNLKDGRYHIVAYTLAEWETGGRCCVYFKQCNGNADGYINVSKREMDSPIIISRHSKGSTGILADERRVLTHNRGIMNGRGMTGDRSMLQNCDRMALASDRSMLKSSDRGMATDMMLQNSDRMPHNLFLEDKNKEVYDYFSSSDLYRRVPDKRSGYFFINRDVGACSYGNGSRSMFYNDNRSDKPGGMFGMGPANDDQFGNGNKYYYNGDGKGVSYYNQMSYFDLQNSTASGSNMITNSHDESNEGGSESLSSEQKPPST